MSHTEDKGKKNWTYRIFALVALVLTLGLSAGIAMAGLPTSLPTGNTAQQVGAPPLQSVGNGVIVGKSYKNDVSPPLRDIPPIPMKASPEHEVTNPFTIHLQRDEVDTVVQKSLAPNAMPTPILNFDGIPFPGVVCNCAPPDTDGEVGQTQYVQMVNEGYQVFNKATGASLLGPAAITTVWTGFGGVCQNNGHGDPIVVYDQIANRWLISQFAGTSVPTDECIAVSTTNDATGTWNRYGFHLGANFFDYPHIGVWPDAYYMGDNVFDSTGSTFLGPQPFAFDRTAMLAGSAATFVSTGLLAATAPYMLPADMDGSILPPAGAPNPFLGADGSPWPLYRFHVDFAIPANSTFTLAANLTPAGYTQLCSATRACVPELGGESLDGIGDRGMFRSAYRRFSDGHEALVGNKSVSSTVAGIRWFEINNATSGAPTFVQQSTYQPDTTWRWMGSDAMDSQGNLALGFSASSATINPQIRYAGRLATDPINNLSQGETTLFAGTGSQLPNTGNRWGDYSDMTIDPSDDCTFWYTQEYYATSGSFNWRTRIGNFKFPTCTNGAVTATPTNTPGGATATNTPIAPTATPTTCPTGNYTTSTSQGVIVPGVTDIGNHCDDCTTGITLPFPFTLYDTTYNTAQAGSNGFLAFGTADNFFYTGCLPHTGSTYNIFPYAVDQITGATGNYGIFTTTTGTAPNRTFYIEWRACRYNGATTCLAGSDANYEIVLNEGQTSFQIVYGVFGTANATVGAIGVQKDTTTYTQYSCNTGGPTGQQITFTLPSCGTATNTPVPPTATRTNTPVPPTATATACTSTNYTYTAGTGAVIPGTTSVALNCDDCSTLITLPFNYQLYDTVFSQVRAGSNGELGFGTDYAGFGVTCLPNGSATYTIAPYWVDQYPVTATCATCGVFTVVTGTAPNRIFSIEWRNAYYPGNATPNLDYEVQLLEGQTTFNLVYGLVTSHTGGTDSALTVGVQQNTTNFTQVGCDATGTNPPAQVATGVQLTFTLPSCSTATDTPVAATATNTPVAATATATATACISNNYVTTTTTGVIVPGTTSLGNSCDDCTSPITFPFPFTFYGTSYTTGVVSSNGSLQFTGNSVYLGAGCLPNANLGASIMPYQDDLHTGNTGEGVFTLTTGTAPNRIFYVEWRTHYFGRSGTANFEIVFTEGSPNFSIIYGANADNGASEVSGIQASATGPSTQFSCLTSTLTAGLQVNYVLASCGPTATDTPAVATATATLCPPSAPALNIASAQNPVVVDGGVKSPVQSSNGKPTRPQSEIVKSASVSGSTSKLAQPVAPNVILYDQYNNAAVNSTVSQDFETANDAFDNQLADDFVVPAGQTWQVNEVDAQGVYFNGPGPAASFNVYFYTNSGTLPATPVYTATNLAYTNIGVDFVIPLTTPANLAGGASYWVSVQARMDFTPGGEFGWTDRTVTSNNPAAWRNPGGGFGTACTDWGARGVTCGIDNGSNDQVYRLNGTIVSGGGCPTNTPVAATATATCSAGAPSLGPWAPVATYTAVVESPAVGTDGTLLFTAGGNVAGSASNISQRYNPATNTWSAQANLPTAVYAIRGVYAANVNKFYVFGGYNGAVQALTQVYDVAANTWSAGAPMPSGRYFPSLAYNSANGKIYVIGGFDPTFVEANQTWQYDPVANTWDTTRANIPTAMAGAATSIVGQFIYLAGTWGGGVGSTLHYRYDIVGNTWSTRAALPAATYSASTGVSGTTIFMFGGGNASLNDNPLNGSKTLPGIGPLAAPASSYNTTWVYNTTTDSWTAGPNMTMAHSFTNGAAVGNRLVIVGGYTGTSDTNVVESAVITVPSCTTTTPTSTSVPATNTNTPVSGTATATATACPSGQNYTITSTTGVIVPGTTNTGNACDDCATLVTLPFPVTIYGQTFSTANVTSNGQLDFGPADTAFTNSCLPDASTSVAIFPYWDDQRTDVGTGVGIFTVQVGNNFYIEWRTTLFTGGTPEDYEVVLTNGSPNFSIIYGPSITDTASETIGVQSSATGPVSQYKCNTTGGAVTPNLQLNFTLACVVPSPTSTNTPVPPTATRTNTPGGPTATATTCVPSFLNIASAQNPVVVDGGVKSPVQSGSGNGNGKPTRPQSDIVKSGSSSGSSSGSLPKLAQPVAPNVILYDQYDNAAVNSTVSQDFETANDAFDNQLADDFVVPAATTWSVNEVDAQGVYFNGPGPAASFNVYFYTNSGTLPATPVYTATNLAYTNIGVDFVIPLTTPANLAGGASYWVSVQARMDFTPGGEFGWTDRTVTSNNPAAWRNPGGGFGTACTDWGARGVTCGIDNGSNDQVYRLNGTIVTGGGCPTATNTPVAATATRTNTPVGATSTNTPVAATATRTNTPVGATSTNTPVAATATATVCTASNYVTAVSAGTIVAGTTDTGNHCDDCTTGITLPFPFTLYDTSYTTASVGSNGFLAFGTADNFFYTGCLPDATATYNIFPYAVDQITGATGNYGIFTTMTGTAPNRIFSIEWRSCRYNGATTCLANSDANYEIQLLEGSTTFRVIFGAMGSADATVGAVGVEKNSSTFTQYSCNTGGTTGQQITFTLPSCGTATNTPVGATSTNTPVGATATRTNTVGVATATATICVGGTPGPWVTGTPYPITDVRYGFAQVGNSFYVIGGVSGGTRVATVYRYDTGPGTWTLLANIPVASEDPTCAYNSSNNSIYCAEGDTGSGFFRYDIATNVWTTLTNVPGPANRYGAASGAFNGKVFVVGGNAAASTDVEVYDVTAGTWSAGTAVPTGFFIAGYQPVGQYLYVVGGFTAGGPVSPGSSKPIVIGNAASVLDASQKSAAAPSANNAASYRLDMTSAPGVWSTGPAFTPARADFGLAYDPGTTSLYAIGGDATGGGYFNSTNLVDSLNVSAWPAGTWTSSPPVLPAPNRQANQAGFYGAGDIWSVGGIDGATFTFYNIVNHRSNGAVSCATPTTIVATATSTNTPVAATSTRTNTPPFPTSTNTPPFPTSTNTAVGATATATCVSGINYNYTLGSGGFIAGTTRIDGAGCDDCTTAATLPFPVSIYGTSYTTANAGSNGVLGFGTTNNAFQATCMPVAGAVNQIDPFWRDQRTDCASGCGIYTATTGTAPNRIFTIEYRTIYFGETSATPTLDYAVNLYESGSPAFDFAYQLINATTQTARVTSIGVQQNSTNFTQYACDSTGQVPPVSSGQRLIWTLAPCGTPTNTPVAATATRTNTPVAATATNTTVAATATATCVSGGGGGGTPVPWATASPMAVDAYGMFTASDGTYFYAGGGYSFSGSGQITQFERYNPATGSWTPLAAVPDITNGLAAAEYVPSQNKIYVFGGDDATTGTVVNFTRIYDVATNTWSAGAAMPDVRAFMAHGYFNGKIYLVGGYSTGNVSPAFANVWEYDPVANTFNTTRLDMPHALGGAASGVVNGHLIVAGGRDAANLTLNSTYDYDIVANTWATDNNLPVVDNVPAGAVIAGNLWVMGGGNPFSGPSTRPIVTKSNPLSALSSEAPSTTNSLYIFNQATNTWSTGPSLIQPRSFPAGGTIGNKVLVVGGYTGSTTTASLEVNNTTGGGGGGCVTSTATPTTVVATATRTNTPAAGTATATCSPSSSYRVLIAYADVAGPPTGLQTQILAETGVTAVDLFDAAAGTPTLAQLQQYEIVVIFSNNPFSDATTLGDNAADYMDSGGVVVQMGFSFYGPGQAYGINGRWASGGYSPYNYSTNLVGSVPFTLGTFNAGHPLMQGVTTLNSNYQNIVTLATGATEVAAASNGNSLIAYKATSGHTAVGITAYVGTQSTMSGQWGKVVVNAGRWLRPAAPCVTATNTVVAPTATRTNTVAPATATATCVPSGGIVDVSIGDNFFAPPTVTIPQGTTIRWTNNTTSSRTHTTTSTTGVWDSGNLTQGMQFSFTFNTPGTYNYQCSIHGAAMSGTIIVQPAVPCATATRTNTAVVGTATATVCTTNYTIATATGTIIAGVTDTGNHCDDCLTTVALPFPYTLYDQTFTSVNVDSNGTLQFPSGGASNFTNTCLPATGYTYTIFPYWDDLYSVNTGFGTFTTVTGTAPNRIFSIEWRTQYFPGSGNANFEVQLYEGQSRFDVIFGTISNGSSSATLGVQKDTTNFTQYSCNTAGVVSGSRFIFTAGSCGTATPTSTAGAATATRTNTPVAPTATNTAGVATATATICVPSGLNIASAQNPVVVDGGVKSPVQSGNGKPTGPGPQSPIVKSAAGSGSAPASKPAQPVAPNVVLYDQYNNASTNATVSQDFETANDTFDSQVGDDFAVPSGQTWSVNEVDVQGLYFNGAGPAISFNVYFYMNSGTLPATPVYTATNLAYTNTAGNFVIPLTTPANLAGGASYWVSAQARMDFTVGGEFGWSDRTVASNSPAAFRNPGGGFACPAGGAWAIKTSCVPTAGGPDNVFRLNGTIVSGGGCPTGTPTTVVATATRTNTPVAPTATNTAVVPTATRTNTVSVPTATRTNTAVVPPTSTSTNVVPPTATRTNTGIVPTSTSTTIPATSTSTATDTPVQPTACPIQFADVLPGSEFYPYVRCLACRKVANGYPCGGPGEPCDANHDGYFRPFANITRGQIAKMVSIAAGFGEDPGPQIYEDVPVTQTFYPYINRLTNRGLVGGYTCGGPFEPCVPPANRPYFRPGANATRGQVSKIVANAAGIVTPIPAGQQTYEDVPSSNPFWVYIERLSDLGVMGGYTCGGPGEPCVPPGNRPYFRPFALITRSQTAKIVANTFFPNCQTPQR